MPQFHVDAQPFAAAQGAGTYAELLAILDPAMAAHARIVTGIRINGVEEPAFREASLQATPLAAADVVEVQTRTVQALAHDALGDTVRLMPSVAEAAEQLARQLGQPNAEADAASLAELAEGLTLLVTLVQAADAWADAGQVAHGDWLGAHVVEVGRCIDAINEGQRAGDWVAVADALAYDLVPAIAAWRATLAQALAEFGEAPLAAAAGPVQ